MARYLIADRVFDIAYRHEYVADYCKDYLYCGDRKTDYKISVSDKEIEAENIDEAKGQPKSLLESIAIYRKICDNLLLEDCFLVHSAVIEYKGAAYAFAAKSGTGKTTHIDLWKKRFGDAVTIINGDKPIIRRIKNDNEKYSFIAYGTPWSGKEGLNTNKSAELKGIFLLSRGEENSVGRAKDGEAVPFLLGQITYKNDAEYLDKLFDFLDSLICNIPIWNLYCNMDISAAELSEWVVSQVNN